MSTGRTWNGIRHGRGCACELCDPKQALLARARADALARQGAPAAAIVATVTPAAPRADWADRFRAYRRRLEADVNSQRMCELLKAGRTFSEAAQIIESETKGVIHHGTQTERTGETEIQPDP